MKKTGFSLLLALCLVSLCITAHAAPSRLSDGADLLTSSEEAQLSQLLDEVSARHKVDIVIVTVDSTQGSSLMAYADDYFDYGGYAEDGILLLVSMEQEEWHVSTTGYGITAVTDAGLEHMADQFVPYLSDAEYAQAFLCFAGLCDEFITQARTGDPYDTHNLPKAPFSWGISLAVSLIVGLVATFLITGSMKRKLKSVKWQAEADRYITPGSLELRHSRDIFLYSQLTRTERPSSGGSSTHVSSSGTTHGGGGGKF